MPSLSKLDACRPQLCAKLQLINGIEVLQVVAARIARCLWDGFGCEGLRNQVRALIAAGKHLIRDASLNGLLRKPIAPPSSARFRCFSFG